MGAPLLTDTFSFHDAADGHCRINTFQACCKMYNLNLQLKNCHCFPGRVIEKVSALGETDGWQTIPYKGKESVKVKGNRGPGREGK